MSNPPYPISGAFEQEAEAYGYYPTFQPRIQPARAGYTGGPVAYGRGIVFDGYPNRTWALMPTNALKYGTSLAPIRGFSYSRNLNSVSMAWPSSNGKAGSAPSTGIYTGVDDEKC